VISDIQVDNFNMNMSGLYDFDTKLYRFSASDYDPTIGRWTTKDPIKFEGGSTNLYEYVKNDPINNLDPTGFSPDIIQVPINNPWAGGGIPSYSPSYLTPTLLIPMVKKPTNPTSKRDCKAESKNCFIGCSFEEYRNKYGGSKGKCFERCADSYTLFVKYGGTR
jgi:RHS repeat-associated protein